MRWSRRGFLRTTVSAATALCVSRGTAVAEPNPSADDTPGNLPLPLNPLRLEPVDLRRFIRLGVEHIYRGAIDPRLGHLPYVRFVLTDGPGYSNHEYWGSPHMEGRFLDALSRCGEVVDVPCDEEAVNALRALVHNSLDNSWGLPLWNLPDQDGKKCGNMHDCREVLLGLVGLAKWKKCERSLELARNLVRAMDKATSETGGYPSSLLFMDGWRLPPEPGIVNYTCGRAIGALTDYYRFTKDELALDLAKRFAEHCVKNAFTPEGDLSDGAGAHLHSSTGTMASLLDLGVLTNDAHYVVFGRRLYDVFLKRYRSSFGWAKESKDPWPHRGEANNTGDYIEAALTLAQNGAPEYYLDAERFVRNGLLAAQIINTDWIVQSDAPDNEDMVYSRIRERAVGGFAFTTPNGYHSYNTDLMGGALRALCKTQQAAVRNEGEVLHINMLFPVDTPGIAATSQLPKAGAYEIHTQREGKLRIRLMEGVAKDEISLTINGQPAVSYVEHGLLFVDALPSEATVILAFDLSKRHTTETPLGWETCEIDWRGNTIVAMTPRQGPVTLYGALPS